MSEATITLTLTGLTDAQAAAWEGRALAVLPPGSQLLLAQLGALHAQRLLARKQQQAPEAVRKNLLSLT